MPDKNFMSAHPNPPTTTQATAAPKRGDTKLTSIYASAGAAGFFGSHKDDLTVRFHATQAFLTTVVLLALHAVLGALGGPLLLLQTLTDLAGFGFSVYQVYRAYEGRPIEVPFIGAIARDHAEPGGGPGPTLQ